MWAAGAFASTQSAALARVQGVAPVSGVVPISAAISSIHTWQSTIKVSGVSESPATFRIQCPLGGGRARCRGPWQRRTGTPSR
jgi:hypothetical protein